ncbi:MAG TPA: S16 family serine protease [Chthoniobacteraceae bacterium]|nr:S16 family serine protease [Chthoniobacteraceae bacterium]
MKPVRPFFLGIAFSLGTLAPAPADAPQPTPPRHLHRTTVGELHEATVSSVYLERVGKEMRGGTAQVIVSISQNPFGAPAVGVLEEYFDGIGSQYRSSVWIAAMAASQASSGMINDRRFTVQVGSRADGPSMGLLVTGTMLALLQGAELLPDVTLTGAVNPDGTAGPVGGLVLKLEAVREAGFKTFGYPVGCRMETDPRTGKLIDLEARGRELGLKVVEVRNLYDAYELLTGREWPRVTPLAESRLALSGPLATRIAEACTGLGDDLERRAAALGDKAQAVAAAGKTLPVNGKALPEVDRMLHDFSRDHEAANLFRQRAKEATAGGAIAQAYLNLRVADQLFGIAEVEEALLRPLLQKKSRENAVAAWKTIHRDAQQEAGKHLLALKELLRSRTGDETLGERVDVLHSYLQYGEALVDYLFARQQEAEITRLFARAEGEDFPRLLEALKATTISYTRAARRAETTLEWSKFTAQPGPPVVVRPELYEKLGKAYASASAAAIGYLDALIIQRDARNRGMTREQASAAFEREERDYGFIKAATRFAERELQPGATGDLSVPTEPLERFTTALYAYTGASSLLMKHYSFHAELPTDGGTAPGSSAFIRRKALSATLDGARERVLEESAKLEMEAGIVPDSIKLNFDLATTLRDGNSDAERLLALRAYWRCNLLCYLTRLLARQE